MGRQVQATQRLRTGACDEKVIRLSDQIELSDDSVVSLKINENNRM